MEYHTSLKNTQIIENISDKVQRLSLILTDYKDESEALYQQTLSHQLKLAHDHHLAHIKYCSYPIGIHMEEKTGYNEVVFGPLKLHSHYFL